MSEETSVARPCPKDGTAMEAMGRRGRAWRCPECRGVFLDTEAMRGGAEGRPSVWAPIVMSVIVSVLASAIVRRLRHPKT